MCEGEERRDELDISDQENAVASLQPSEGGTMFILSLSFGIRSSPLPHL